MCVVLAHKKIPSVWAKRKVWGSYQTLSTKYFDVIKNIIDASGEAWKVTFEWEWGKYSRKNMSTEEYSISYWLYWTNTIYLILFSPVWKTKRTRCFVLVKWTHTTMSQDIGQSLSVANRGNTNLWNEKAKKLSFLMGTAQWLYAVPIKFS